MPPLTLALAGVGLALALIVWALCRIHGTLEDIADALVRIASDEETEE